MLPGRFLLTAPQEGTVADDGLDREAVRRHYWSTRASAGPWHPVAQHVPALLDALEAAEAEVARLKQAVRLRHFVRTLAREGGAS